MAVKAALSPRYAVLLGAACGFFVVGTVLVLALLISDFGAEAQAGPEVAGPKGKNGPGREKLLSRIKEFDDGIARLNEQLEDLERQLAEAKATKSAGPAASKRSGSDGTEPPDETVSADGSEPPSRDYSGSTGAPNISMSDPAVVAALHSLGYDDEGHEQEWREAVQTIYREVRRDQYATLRNRTVDRQVRYVKDLLDLTEQQQTRLSDLLREVNAKMADLYSRQTPDNVDEIRQENERFHLEKAEEFRRHLSTDQASGMSGTLYSWTLPKSKRK